MRVDDRNLTSVPAAEPGRTQETQRAGRGEGQQNATGSSSGDQVELSSTLGSLSRAMSAYGSDRSSRVETLAAQYKSGTYEPDSMGTSKGMISEALGAGTK